MRYATIETFLRLFPIDLEGNAEYPISEDDRDKAKDQISTAIDNAASEIDVYLAGLGEYPSSLFPYLEYANCVIARKSLDLYSDRKKIQSDYDDVICNLKKIASGELNLPTTKVLSGKQIFTGDRSINAVQIRF